MTPKPKQKTKRKPTMDRNNPYKLISDVIAEAKAGEVDSVHGFDVGGGYTAKINYRDGRSHFLRTVQRVNGKRIFKSADALWNACSSVLGISTLTITQGTQDDT